MSDTALKNTTHPGFGIYLHWPFCESKCPYCDFNSHVNRSPPDQNRFLEAFKSELRFWAEKTSQQTVNSIFIGGGTPSLMEPRTVEGLLETVSAYWSVSENVEITMEANPSSVEANRFRGYHSAGVNRVSLGVQALNDKDLKILGRLHDVKSAISAIETARNEFDRISFDLIYARPGQGISEWRTELASAFNFGSDHLSLYQLTIEPNTPFQLLYESGKLKLPDSDESAEFYEATQEICESNSMPAYEISNHAAENAQCRHNLLYWRYGDYIGAGPGAHGRITLDGQRHSSSTECNPETWLKKVESTGNGLIEFKQLTKKECGNEYLLMALRMVEGINLKRFESLSGQSLDSNKISELVRIGMLSKPNDNQIKPTKEAFLLTNSIVSQLAI